MLLYVDRQDGCVVIELKVLLSFFESSVFGFPLPSPPPSSSLTRHGKARWSVLEKAEY